MSKTNKFHIDWHFSRPELIVTVISAIVLCSCLFFVLFAYTPLHDIIPGYPTPAYQLKQVETAMRIDSLERSIRRWEVYSENLRNVISGRKTKTMEELILQADTSSTALNLSLLAETDESLRNLVQEEERFEISDRNMMTHELEGIHFFTPVNGSVAVPFDSALHPYIDIGAAEGSTISAVSDGSVIYTEWSEAYGWSIIIQHDNGLITIYRHNQKLLKKVADRVNAGTAIGLLGSSSVAEGCHLQFEMWQDGTPVDPANYMNLKEE